MRKFVLLIMIVLSAGALALAQNKRISGTVKGVDGKPIAGFDPTRDGAYKVAAGAKVRISDVPSDWKLDKTESGSKLVFTASKGGTAVTWTFEYQANGGSSATDPGNGGGSNAGGDGQGDPGKTPDTSKPAASPKPAGTADDGQAAGAAPLASTHPPFPHIHRRRPDCPTGVRCR